jgi:hypothetical protein
MARAGSSDQPASKKAKMSPTRPNTRSAPRPASPEVDADDEDFDEEEPFQYESDIGSADMMDQNEGYQSDSDDMEIIDPAEEKKKQPEFIVLSSDSEKEGTPVAPPEVPKAASKGKMTARKQFAADVASLVESFGDTSDSTIQSELHDLSILITR